MTREIKSSLITSNYTLTNALSDHPEDLINRVKKYVRAILHDSLHIQPSKRLYIYYMMKMLNQHK
jgi:hypothetical protein